MLGKKIGGGLAVVALAVFSVPLAAYALVDNQNEASSQTAQTPASVIVFSQKPKGDQITVTYAFMPTAGHLVIHGSSKNGKPDDAVFGSIPLQAGDHRDIGVKLEKAPAPGTKLWASLTNSEKKSFWPSSLPAENEFHVQ
jgi:hypothetical protein